MTKLHEITTYLDQELNVNAFKDYSTNSLQVENPKTKSVSKVAVAVDAGESIIEKAIKENAELLIVHHGLFWGDVKKITDSLARKISLIMNSNLSLYCSHLPLDAHPVHGNNAIIAKMLKLKNLIPFAEVFGNPVGFYGEAKQGLTLDEIEKHFSNSPGILENGLKLQFGKKENYKIGIISGSGSSAIKECKELSIDCLLTGESKQEAYHEAKESGINCIFLGHYGTETFGVRALGDLLKNKFNVDNVFIDEPTGI